MISQVGVTAMAKSAADIAASIDWLQATYAATSTMLVTLNDNDFLNLFASKGYDHGSTVKLGRKDNTYYEGINLWKSVYTVRENPQFNLNYLGTQLGTMISWIGHDLSKNSYFDKAPLLEFFRHVRNGISHGNAFKLEAAEPRRPAKFRGFEITKSLNGQCVLFEYMSTGDVMDLFDDVKAHLRSSV